MDSLIYSLNATLPVFLVIVVGYVLKQIGILNDGFVKTANKFNFVVTLPVLLFVDLSTTDIIGDFDITYVLYCALVTTVAFFGLWIAAKFLIKDKKIVGEFVQAGYRSSAAILGVAFIQNIYGNTGMAPLMIIGSVPLYNIMAVIVLSFFQPEQKGLDSKVLKKTLIGILTNPIILGIIAGFVWSALKIPMPQILNKTATSIGATATPLGLMAMGAMFDIHRALGKAKPAVTATFIKLIGLCTIFLPIAVLLGFRNEELLAILVMLGSGTTVACYVMSRNMGHEGVLTSSVVMLTTLFSSFTVTGWLYILKTLRLI